MIPLLESPCQPCAVQSSHTDPVQPSGSCSPSRIQPKTIVNQPLALQGNKVTSRQTRGNGRLMSRRGRSGVFGQGVRRQDETPAMTWTAEVEQPRATFSVGRSKTPPMLATMNSCDIDISPASHISLRDHANYVAASTPTAKQAVALDS